MLTAVEVLEHVLIFITDAYFITSVILDLLKQAFPKKIDMLQNFGY